MKKNIINGLVGLMIGLAIGSFVYEVLFGGGDYWRAFERSYFQCAALIGAYWFVIKRHLSKQ